MFTHLKKGGLYLLSSSHVWLRLGLVLAAVGALWCGCSSKSGQKGTELDERYKDWLTVSAENVVIRYPADHQFASQMGELARGYVSALRRDCRLLEIPVPRDTLTVYFYKDYQQGREMTGQNYPFATKHTILFWQPARVGASLMRYLLPRWSDKEPQYKFLKHGLIALLDDSGRNYHQMTRTFQDSSMFIGLVDLSKDSTVDSDIERYQSAEGASFVDFILYTYGMPALKALYLAGSPIELISKGVLRTDVDSLQAKWLRYVDLVVAGQQPPREKMPWSGGKRPADTTHKEGK